MSFLRLTANLARILVLALTAACIAGVSGTAWAQSGSLISPADGAHVALGYAGPIQIDLTGLPANTYYAEVYDADYYDYDDYTSYAYDGDQTNALWSLDVPPIYSPGWYSVEVTDVYGESFSTSSFYVDHAAASVVSPTAGITKLVGSDLTAKVRWDS